MLTLAAVGGVLGRWGTLWGFNPCWKGTENLGLGNVGKMGWEVGHSHGGVVNLLVWAHAKWEIQAFSQAGKRNWDIENGGMKVFACGLRSARVGAEGQIVNLCGAWGCI